MMLHTTSKQDMEAVPDTDEFPLVEIPKGKQIIKQIDFEISVEKVSETEKKENKSQDAPW